MFAIMDNQPNIPNMQVILKTNTFIVTTIHSATEKTGGLNDRRQEIIKFEEEEK